MSLVQYQFPLIMLAVLVGSVITGICLCKPSGHRIWVLADLIWVVFGLFGALGAVVTQIYAADSSRIERQIDIAHAAITDFDEDVSRFRLRYCDGPRPGELAVLCDKADFLAASTATNVDLPLFIDVAEQALQLRSLNPFSEPRDTGAMPELRVRADSLDTRELLAFQPLDETTRPALDALQAIAPGIAGEFRILARSYDALIDQIRRLQQEWIFIESRAWLLKVQVLAICLVSFAAPFRLGRAIADLRASRRG